MTDDVALLLRRAAFGPTSAELATARRVGLTATRSALLTPAGPDTGAANTPIPPLGPDPFADKPSPNREQRIAWENIRRRQATQITGWWLDRMTAVDHQAVEKMSFFWHGHWATSVKKVHSPQLMLVHYRILRDAGDFATMARRMVTDPALVYWLDGQLNTRNAPNENLARELLELFTVGIGHYTEQDIKEAARALTGWRIHLGLERSTFDPRRHDAGRKTILGRTENFTATSLVDLLLGREECPRFIASRLWLRYGSSTTPLPGATRDRMVAAFPAPMAMLRALLDDEAFRDSRGTMVKQPVEWLVGAMRQLALRPSNVPERTLIQILRGLENLGQLPFAPPSVGGWPAGAAWLTSAAAQVRLGLASELAKQVNTDRWTPEDVAYVLCIDAWTDRTYAVLRGVRDPRLLLTLGLVSPEYLVT